METYRTWAHLFGLMRYYLWIVDRFHLSTRTYQLQTYGVAYDFRWLEEQLHALGFHIVFCIRTPESFAAAREERLTVSSNPRQYDDLGVVIREQEQMRKLVGESILPVLELDVSGGDVGCACDKMADWLEQTGGLWTR